MTDCFFHPDQPLVNALRDQCCVSDDIKSLAIFDSENCFAGFLPFRMQSLYDFVKLVKKKEYTRNFIALEPLMVLQMEPSNIHVLPFTPLLVSALFSRSSRKGYF